MKGEVGMSSEVMGLCFSSFWGETHTRTRTLSSGPLGLKEMSVCGLIQPPVPVLMMASTCCFNVTAGSPSIPHWLWLPSAAGSSPLHTPPSIYSPISASFISLHFHLPFLLPLISTLPPLIHLSATLLLTRLFPTAATSPPLPHFCPSFLFSQILSFLSFLQWLSISSPSSSTV